MVVSGLTTGVGVGDWSLVVGCWSLVAGEEVGEASTGAVELVAGGVGATGIGRRGTSDGVIGGVVEATGEVEVETGGTIIT